MLEAEAACLYALLSMSKKWKEGLHPHGRAGPTVRWSEAVLPQAADAGRSQRGFRGESYGFHYVPCCPITGVEAGQFLCVLFFTADSKTSSAFAEVICIY